MTRLHLSIPDPDPGDPLPDPAEDEELLMAGTLANACYSSADEARVLRIINSTAHALSADIMVAAAILLANQVSLMGGGPAGDWSEAQTRRVALLALGRLARRVELRELAPSSAELHLMPGNPLIALGALYERLFRLTVERPDCLRFLRAHKALHAAIEVWPRNREQARIFALTALTILE